MTCACWRVGRNHSAKLPEQSSDGKRENIKQPCTTEVPDRSGLVHPVQEPQYFKSRTNRRYVHVSTTSLRGMGWFSRNLAFSSVVKSLMAFFLFFFLFNPSQYEPYKPPKICKCNRVTYHQPRCSVPSSIVEMFFFFYYCRIHFERDIYYYDHRFFDHASPSHNFVADSPGCACTDVSWIE